MVRRFLSVAQEQGVTLIELLLATVIGIGVILAITLGYVSSLKALKGGQRKVELQREGAFAVETIVDKVREGNEIIVDDYNGGTKNRVNVIEQTPTTTIYYRYYWDPADNALKVTVDDINNPPPSAPVTIIPNYDNYETSSLIFEDPGSDHIGVNIDLTLNEISGFDTEPVSFSTTTYIRDIR